MSLSFGLSTILNFLLDTGLDFVDRVVSWIFRLFPNNFLLGSFDALMSKYFDFLTEISLSLSPYLNMKLFAYFLFITFYMEMTYVIIRFLIWIIIKIVKP